MRVNVLRVGMFFMILFLMFVCPRFVRASDLGFDERVQYDIYFRTSGEEISVINDVEIERMQEIGGRSFLVVKSKGFKLQEAEGFILFDEIIAILPEGNFRINPAQRIRIK